jgi:hypothetical protein
MRFLLVFLVALVVSAGARAADGRQFKTLSFVLLAEPQLPAAADYRAMLEARLKGRLKIDGMEAEDGKVILFRLRGGTAMVGLIEAPLPAGELDGLCRSAWYWKDACAAVARHHAHALVATAGVDLDPLDTALLQTDLVAALMGDNAIASYWGASLQSPQDVRNQSSSASREAPPVWLWVNFRLSGGNQPGWSLSTQGLDAFGLMEIETRDAKRPGYDVFSLLLGTAAYLIQKGPVILDGETIGDSPALNIRVRHGPSYWRSGVKVYRVEFP